MKFRTTLILLALVVGLLAFLVLYTLRRPGAAEYEEDLGLIFPPTELGGKLTEQVVGLELLWKDKAIALSRPSPSSRDWRMTQPITALADPETISAILATLESLKPIRTLGRHEEIETFKEYGLAPPETRIRFALPDGRSCALGIGAITADEKSVYAMRPEDSLPDIVILPRTILDMAQTEASDLREKRLMRFDPEKADRLTLAVTGDPAAELHKDPKGWEIVKPISDFAEQANVLGLLQALSARVLNRESFTDLAPEACGLDKPPLTVTVFEGEKSAILRIGGPAPDGKNVCISRDGDPGIILLDASLAQTLRENPEELRARQALPFLPEEITALTVSGPAPIKLERMESSWRLISSEKPADAERVRLFLRRLSELEVKERVDDPTAEQLAQDGLEPPRQTISVETRQALWELRFGGNVPGSTLVYARRGSSGPVLTVPDTIVEMLAEGEKAFAERIVALDLRKEKLSSIRIESQGRGILIVRDGKGWALKEPSGVLNQDAVSALLLELSLVETLRALPRPERLGDYGLDKPQAVVTISTEGPPAAERKLLLGNKRAEGGVYAMNHEGDRVLVLDEAILESLRREFVAK